MGSPRGAEAIDSSITSPLFGVVDANCDRSIAIEGQDGIIGFV